MKSFKFFVIILFVNYSHSFSGGAGSDSCTTLVPRHGSHQPQTSSPPFLIVLSTTSIQQGQNMTITLENTTQTSSFRGFMIQARTVAATPQIIGTFFVNGLVRHVTCSDVPLGSVATHTNAKPKTKVDLTWQAPFDIYGLINFQVTMLENIQTFWTGMSSEFVTITQDHDRTTTSTEIPSSDLYKGCGSEKVCFGSPRGCVNSENCNMFGAVKHNDETFVFEILSQSMDNHEDGMSYVAFALSHDNRMGRDSVIECVRENDVVRAYTSFTIVEPSLFASQRIPNQNIIRLIESRIEDNKIYCRVERENYSIIESEIFDLLNDKQFLLLAMGTELRTNSIGSHGGLREASEEAVLLTQPRNLEAGGARLFIMLHGSFMIVAWIGTAPIGIFLARYFKQTWKNQQICGKDAWFFWHTILMLMTCVLVISSCVIIFIDVREWRTSIHAITGSITVALLILQPVGAIFRPAASHHKRPIFNFIHFSMGNIIYSLAIITIFFAVPKPAANLPRWTFFIFIAFVLFYLMMHFILTVIGISGDAKSSERNVVINISPFSLISKTLFCLITLILFAFAIALILIMVW
ncbi:CLUMA_CG008351, isoform A [Clunio marinus]|uniref:CLUMA_CG008351, isoform A n=1 Tax=Clunio marinus TaxID=568069 RepID=A0A1J1I3T4_9DIPT|nr:CLUMA_CG008351, isoform A [Clunio marinus]